jgi:hypothetical protein
VKGALLSASEAKKAEFSIAQYEFSPVCGMQQINKHFINFGFINSIDGLESPRVNIGSTSQCGDIASQNSVKLLHAFW